MEETEVCIYTNREGGTTKVSGDGGMRAESQGEDMQRGDWAGDRQEAGKPAQVLFHHLRKEETKTLGSVNIQEKGNLPVVALILEEEKIP